MSDIKKEFEKAVVDEITKQLTKIDSPADFELGALWAARWAMGRCAEYCGDSTWQLPAIKASGEIMASGIRQIAKELES